MHLEKCSLLPPGATDSISRYYCWKYDRHFVKFNNNTLHLKGHIPELWLKWDGCSSATGHGTVP